MNLRFYKNKCVAADVAGGRCENVSDSCCIGRCIPYEESAVGTNLCCILLKYVITQGKTCNLIEHLEGKCGIGAASSKSCTCGYVLVQCHFYFGQLVVGSKNLVCLYNKIVVVVAIEHSIVHFKCKVGRVGILYCSNLKYILKRDGVEYGLEVMIAVRALRHDIESEVYFCVRECYHWKFLFAFMQK